MVKLTEKQKENKWIERVAGRIGRGRSSANSATLKTYARRIKKVFHMLYPDRPFIGSAFLNRESQKVIRAIEESNIADSSKKDMYVAIVASYPPDARGKTKNGLFSYKRKMNEWLIELDDRSKKQKKTNLEEKKWVSAEVIEKARSDLLKKALITEKKKDMMDFYALSFFTLLPPRRAADYGEMKISYNEDLPTNVLVPTQASDNYKKFHKFVFNDFKLSEKKGSETFTREYVENLPRGKEIVDMLDSLVKLQNIGYIFDYARNEKAMSKYISRLSKRTLGKAVNINVFRHIYISNFLKTNPFLLQKEMVATFMSHSVQQQALYRRREKEEEINEEEHLKGFERGKPEIKKEEKRQ